MVCLSNNVYLQTGLSALHGLFSKTGLHRDPLAPLGAAARQNCSSALGLHAAAKPVGLRAAAAIRLKCALRHGTALLNFIFWKNAARQTLEKNATSGQRLIISHPAKAAKYVPRDDFFTIHGASYYLRKKCRETTVARPCICASIGND